MSVRFPSSASHTADNYLKSVMVKSTSDQVIHVDPDWSSPIWRVVLSVSLVVQRRRFGKRAQTVLGPQKVGIAKVFKKSAQLGRARFQQLHHEGEEADVAKGVVYKPIDGLLQHLANLVRLGLARLAYFDRNNKSST